MAQNETITAKWLEDAIFYQIMPDRFCRADNSAKTTSIDNRVLVDWHSKPGKSGLGGQEFYGGNLRGIHSKLDYIRELGANTILLTPINAAPSYHRYDTTDHCALDPLLGTWEDLELLICDAHARGLRIVCDIALNHVSHQHPWFLAAADRNARERSYFKFTEDGSYHCWWGFHTLPELQLSDPFLQDYLFSGENSVLSFWLKKGFDGIRLDCANDLSLPVCEKIAKVIRARFPDAALIGEVANFAVPWLRALDAVQSYFFTASLKSLYAKSISTRQLLHNLTIAYGSGDYRQFQMLSSHDTCRANTDFAKDAAFLKAARRLQFTLPGIPMLYYGEEVGMSGMSDPDNRAGMPWEKKVAKKNLLSGDEIRTLTRLRANSPELRNGHWHPIITDMHPNLFAFYRAFEQQPERLTLVTWNNSNAPCKATLTIPWGWLFSEVKLIEAFTDKITTASAGLLTVNLAAGECAIWQVRDGSKKNYSFYKKFSS